ncbi:hypothetical protein UB46_18570 [Burkholderiaceae bacterium 16]|nr:hypothetical protein UB46_18570 [Burkholderiaceae bacterium 16]
MNRSSYSIDVSFDGLGSMSAIRALDVETDDWNTQAGQPVQGLESSLFMQRKETIMTNLRSTATRIKLLLMGGAVSLGCAAGTTHAQSSTTPAAQTATQIDSMNSALNADSSKNDKGSKKRVTPPPRPPYLTSIEPGVPAEQMKKMEHGHRHGGYNQGKFDSATGGFTRD